MSLIKSSDLSKWCERLNAVRNKSGIILGDETVETVSSNNIIRIESINSLHNKINSLKSNKYLNHATFTLSDTSEIDNNTIISENIKKNIEDTLTSLEGICANDSTTVCTTYSQSNSTCQTKSCTTYNDQCRTCSTNSTYDNYPSGCATNSASSSGGRSTCATDSTCSTCNRMSVYSTLSNSQSSYDASGNSTCSTCITNSTCSQSSDSNCITYSNGTCSDCNTCRTNSTNSESCKTDHDTTCSTYNNQNSTLTDTTYSVNI